MQASTQLRNSSPKPGRRCSYQSYASLMSCSASGTSISSAAISDSNPGFHVPPRNAREWLIDQIGLAPCELLFLPLVNRNIRWDSGEIVPEVLDQLQFFWRSQIKE